MADKLNLDPPPPTYSVVMLGPTKWGTAMPTRTWKGEPWRYTREGARKYAAQRKGDPSYSVPVMCVVNVYPKPPNRNPSYPDYDHDTSTE